MRTALLWIATGGMAWATPPELHMPVDCELGKTCFIQQFVDHDPTTRAKDFTCGPLSYDGHKGTDFGLPSLASMHQGVDVLAAAGGTVVATRDGMEDVYYTKDRAETIKGKDCGNGIVIRHADGWETQYCHLQQGSVIVEKGQYVNTGDVLGQVGLSGRTQFPHLHISVRHNGETVDPFQPDALNDCTAAQPTDLWADDMPYTAGGVLSAGFFDAVPNFSMIREGTAHHTDFKAKSPALVLWGYAFGGQAGDSLHLMIDGPQGRIIDHSANIERNHAQFFRAAGKKLTASQWPSGTYTGTIRLIRDGTEIDRLENTTEIR